jgi:DNA-binding transcriptional regulator YdaS (Cro superfamily)
MAKDKVLREVLHLIGGTRALARELGIDHAAISRWERVPPLRVLEIERLTGVSRYRLRPDVYGRAPPEAK